MRRDEAGDEQEKEGKGGGDLNLTRPRTVSALSISVMFWRKSLATDLSASSGHSENQSMVQQFTKLGNCRSRARKTSPIGLQKEIHKLKQWCSCKDVCTVHMQQLYTFTFSCIYELSCWVKFVI